MAMFDLVVSGGTHVLPGGAESVDLAVAGGKIVAIGARGSLAALGAARVIDAAGQIVIPGGVDPHIHCSMAITMPNQPEPTVSAPASQVSKAALFGGTTTLIDFVPVAEEATIREAIELRLSDWTGACYCDYGLH
jgi:dihydropyrimidinase